MKNVQIKAGNFLKGSVKVPPSKSLSHRAIIAAALSSGTSRIDNIILSKDIEVTSQCMRNFGADLKFDQSTMHVNGMGQSFKMTSQIMDCHESGSTLRFLIPLALLSNQLTTFVGNGQLIYRPLDPYFKILDDQNITYEYDQKLPLTLKGQLKPGQFKLPGDVSSQFITGLLYALPLLDGDSEILITSPLESVGYVDLTIDVLKQFGIDIEHDKHQKYWIKGQQSYENRDYRVEGDFSQVAFWLVAGLLNGDLTCEDMSQTSKQGDQAVLDIIKDMAGTYAFEEDKIHIKKQKLRATLIDGSQCPDIIPVLTVLASVSQGQTKIINAERLRIKECDRLKAISTELNKLGADIEELEDGLIINGVESLKGGHVEGWNDHRIVMSMAVAALVAKGDVFIKGCDAITKSYPHFFEDYKSLGGQFNEWHLEA